MFSIAEHRENGFLIASINDAAMALLTAAVSFVAPSPVAPKSFTLYSLPAPNVGCAIFGGVKTLSGGSGTPP